MSTASDGVLSGGHKSAFAAGDITGNEAMKTGPWGTPKAARITASTSEPDAQPRHCRRCGLPVFMPRKQLCVACRASAAVRHKANKAAHRLLTHDPLVAHDRHLRRTYGLSLDDYNALLATQGGVCAICKRPERRVSGRK